MTDQSLRKQLDDAHQKIRDLTDQMATLDRRALMGILAGGLAHELNTPLQMICGNAELVERFGAKLDGTTPESREAIEKIVKLIEGISRNSKQCAIVTQTMLRFMLPTEKLNESTGSIEEILDEVVTLCSCHPEFERVVVNRAIVPDIPPVRMAPEMMTQAFMNLMMNAASAMDGAGTIFISVEMDTPKHEVRVRVQDEGPGIPEAIAQTLFEPLQTTRRSSGGSGLGLFLTQYIIHRHGGAIELDRSATRGAAFDITLPAEPSE